LSSISANEISPVSGKPSRAADTANPLMNATLWPAAAISLVDIASKQPGTTRRVGSAKSARRRWAGVTVGLLPFEEAAGVRSYRGDARFAQTASGRDTAAVPECRQWHERVAGGQGEELPRRRRGDPRSVPQPRRRLRYLLARLGVAVVL